MDRLAALILTASACVPPEEGPAVLERASEIVEAPGHTGVGNHDAFLAVNGVRGGGREAGGVDVFSLGLQPGVDDVLVLGFRGVAVDVEGPDLVVFENPFEVSGGGRFMDPVVVEVSPDCSAFVAFPHRRLGSEPDQWSDDPATWSGFAGIEPVLLHAEDHDVDPLGPHAGGDRFDLADLDLQDATASEVLEGGAACVRLSSAALRDDPETGLPFPRHPISTGPDIDGVYAALVR